MPKWLAYICMVFLPGECPRGSALTRRGHPQIQLYKDPKLGNEDPNLGLYAP